MWYILVSDILYTTDPAKCRELETFTQTHKWHRCLLTVGCEFCGNLNKITSIALCVSSKLHHRSAYVEMTNDWIRNSHWNTQPVCSKVKARLQTLVSGSRAVTAGCTWVEYRGKGYKELTWGRGKLPALGVNQSCPSVQHTQILHNTKPYTSHLHSH